MVDKNKQLVILEQSPRPPLFSVKAALNHADKNPPPVGYEWYISTVQGSNKPVLMSLSKITTPATNYRNRDRVFSG